jgi:O-antigen/teichoic acid export membrane protein
VLVASRDAQSQASEVSDLLGHSLALTLVTAFAGLAICVSGGAFISVMLFGDISLVLFVQTAGFLLFFQALAQFAYAGFASLHRFSPYAVAMMLLAPISGLVIVGAGAWWGSFGAAWGAVAAQAMSTIVLFGVLRLECRKMGCRFSPKLSWHGIRPLLLIGMPFYLNSVISVPADYWLQALLVSSHGIAALGDLRVIGAITALVTFLPSAIGGPMISALSRLHATEKSRFMRAAVLNLKVLWIVSASFSAILGFLWAELVGAIFGPAFQIAKQNGDLALLMANLAIGMTVASGAMFSARKGSGLLLMTIIGMGVFSVVGFWSVPSAGLRGYLSAQCWGTAAALTTVLLGAMSEGLIERRTLREIFTIGCATATLFTALGIVAHWGLSTEARVIIAASSAMAIVIGGVSTLFSQSERHIFKEILGRATFRLW